MATLLAIMVTANPDPAFALRDVVENQPEVAESVMEEGLKSDDGLPRSA